MSALPVLSSETSRSQIIAAYLDCSDYDLVGSTARAAVFIRAGRMLLARPVTRTAAGGQGGEEVELEPRIMQDEVAKAETWYAHQSAIAANELRQYAPADDFRD